MSGIKQAVLYLFIRAMMDSSTFFQSATNTGLYILR